MSQKTNMGERGAQGSGRKKVFSYKLVLLGDTAVGKSSIVLRFVKGQFYEFQESTIGAAFLTQTLAVGEDTVNFEIWDTAGQERFHSLAPMYYRGAGAAIVVYDITSQETFERAKEWVKELQRQGSPNAIIALTGNKTDLEENRSVSTDDAKKYADESGLLFMETSAKDASNINDLFMMLGVAKVIFNAAITNNGEHWVLHWMNLAETSLGLVWWCKGSIEVALRGGRSVVRESNDVAFNL